MIMFKNIILADPLHYIFYLSLLVYIMWCIPFRVGADIIHVCLYTSHHCLLPAAAVCSRAWSRSRTAHSRWARPILGHAASDSFVVCKGGVMASTTQLRLTQPGLILAIAITALLAMTLILVSWDLAFCHNAKQTTKQRLNPYLLHRSVLWHATWNPWHLSFRHSLFHEKTTSLLSPPSAFHQIWLGSFQN